MRRLQAILGYFGAVLTVAVMLVLPFVLYGVLIRGVAATGVRVDPAYAGGEAARTIVRGNYRITVHRPVLPRAPLSRVEPFVQLAWAPASALPVHVADEVDLDGDGRADLIARFELPRDPQAPLYVDVTPAGGQVRALRRVSQESFSALIARVGNRVVLRVPLTPAGARRLRIAG